MSEMTTDPFAPADHETQTGDCACGTETTREIPVGRFGEIVRNSPFVCDACQANADEEFEREREQRDREWRAEQRRLDCQRKLHASGLPRMLASRTLDTITGADAVGLAAARRWVAGFADYRPPRRTSMREDVPYEAAGWAGDEFDRRGLLLTGMVGVGKTTLAGAAVRTLTDQNTTIYWVSAPTLFAMMSAGFGSDERERAQDRLTGHDPLAIDDLDKVRPTEYAAELMYVAIDTRYAQGVPLLSTTNLDLAELAAKWPQPYGEAIASRLLGYCEVVKMNGADRRVPA